MNSTDLGQPLFHGALEVGWLTADQAKVVVAAAEEAANGPLTERNFNEVAAKAATVVFAAPKFHFH